MDTIIPQSHLFPHQTKRAIPLIRPHAFVLGCLGSVAPHPPAGLLFCYGPCYRRPRPHRRPHRCPHRWPPYGRLCRQLGRPGPLHRIGDVVPEVLRAGSSVEHPLPPVRPRLLLLALRLRLLTPLLFPELLPELLVAASSASAETSASCCAIASIALSPSSCDPEAAISASADAHARSRTDACSRAVASIAFSSTTCSVPAAVTSAASPTFFA